MADLPFRQVVRPASSRVRYDLKYGTVSTQSIPATPIFESRRWNTANSKEINGYRKPTPLNAFTIKAELLHQNFFTQSRVSPSVMYHYISSTSPNPVPYFRWGTYGPVGSLRPSVNATTAARSVTQAKAKANRQDVNLATSLAEGAQTMQTVVDVATKLGRALKSFRSLYRARLDSDHVRNFTPLSNLAEPWLAFQYGIMPLVHDLHGASKLLKKGLDLRPAVHVTSRVTEDYPLPIRAGYSNLDIVQGEWHCGAFTRLDYRLSNATLHALGQTGLLNPLEVIWELVPYSFVIDWFLPIGTWLSAFTSTVGLTFLGGSTTLRNWGRVKAEFYPSAADGNFMGGQLPHAIYESTCVERTVWSHDPIAMLYMKNPFSLKRTASLAALISQLRK